MSSPGKSVSHSDVGTVSSANLEPLHEQRDLCLFQRALEEETSSWEKPLAKMTALRAIELIMVHAQGGALLVVSPRKSIEHLRMASSDGRYFIGQLKRDGAMNINSDQFAKNFSEFTQHTDDDLWPPWHDDPLARGKRKDGGFAIDDTGTILKAAAKFTVNLASVPWSWPGKGMRHMAAIAVAWGLLHCVVIVRSDSGGIHVVMQSTLNHGLIFDVTGHQWQAVRAALASQAVSKINMPETSASGSGIKSQPALSRECSRELLTASGELLTACGITDEQLMRSESDLRDFVDTMPTSSLERDRELLLKLREQTCELEVALTDLQSHVLEKVQQTMVVRCDDSESVASGMAVIANLLQVDVTQRRSGWVVLPLVLETLEKQIRNIDIIENTVAALMNLTGDLETFESMPQRSVILARAELAFNTYPHNSRIARRVVGVIYNFVRSNGRIDNLLRRRVERILNKGFSLHQCDAKFVRRRDEALTTLRTSCVEPQCSAQRQPRLVCSPTTISLPQARSTFLPTTISYTVGDERKLNSTRIDSCVEPQCSAQRQPRLVCSPTTISLPQARSTFLPTTISYTVSDERKLNSTRIENGTHQYSAPANMHFGGPKRKALDDRPIAGGSSSLLSLGKSSLTSSSSDKASLGVALFMDAIRIDAS